MNLFFTIYPLKVRKLKAGRIWDLSLEIDASYPLIVVKIVMFKNVSDPNQEEMFRFVVGCFFIVFLAVIISLSIDLSRWSST